MNIEFSSVSPEASLREVQDLIIKDRLRILPVLDKGRVAGVITRTDLLSILVGEPVIRDFTYETRHASQFIRKRNMASMLKERFPRNVIQRMKELGRIADLLQYNVYLVGGIVRDVFLKRDNLDVDLVVEGDGIEFAHAFVRHHADVRVRTHHKFGTAVLIFPDGFKVDIATARIEYYESPAAPPIVETSSLKQDLSRRDFTMNTLAVKLNPRHFGTLVDYFGAQKDIKDRVIRVLHNLSFVEDPTRIMRAIRFEQRFGFKIGKLTLALMKNAASLDSFKEMAPRRVFHELMLLLRETEPLSSIERMDGFGLLQAIHPRIHLTEDLREILRETKAVLSWYDRLYLEEDYEPWKVHWLGLTSELDDSTLCGLAEAARLSEPEGLGVVRQRRNTREILGPSVPPGRRQPVRYPYPSFGDGYRTDSPPHGQSEQPAHQTPDFPLLHPASRSEKRFEGTRSQGHGDSPGDPYTRTILDRLLEERMNRYLHTREQEIAFVLEHYRDHVSKEPPHAPTKKNLE